MGLKLGARCETAEGPGTVITIENANRWHPLARLIVELDSGGRKYFQGGQVWEPGQRPKEEER